MTRREHNGGRRWAKGSMVLAVALTSTLAACGNDGKNDSQNDAKPIRKLSLSKAEAQAAKADQAAFKWVAPTSETVGKLATGTAYVGIEEQADGKVTVYVCDGPTTALWFEGQLSGTTASLTHKSGATLTLQKGASGFTGSVTINGAASTFTTAAAAYPAGLWQGLTAEDGLTARSGWIVLADGTMKGAKVKSTATSSAGDLDTGTSTASDGTAASPSSPPTNPSPTQLSYIRCAEIQDVVAKAVKDRAATSDENLKARYTRAISSITVTFKSGGCERFGEDVYGNQI